MGRPVSSLDHCRPARWAVNNADVNGCHVQSPWTSATRVENIPGHRPAAWRTHQDIAHPCGEHTRRVSTSHHRPSVSVSTMVSVLGSCFCLSALFCKVIYYCFIVSVETELYRENTKSPTHVENTPGYRPSVWRAHQESEHVSTQNLCQCVS